MNKKIVNKLIKKPKSNKGFTLIELLAGIVMSGIVIGALGFGLVQIMRTTQAQTSQTKARNEATRAIEFISDELRRAESIETDNSRANIEAVAPTFDNPSTIVIDENGIDDPSDNASEYLVRLALNVPGVSERIIYSISQPSTNTWEEPLVVYRWYPALNNNGEYTNANNPNAWQNQALIDKVYDTAQGISCNSSSVNYKGFFACIDPNGISAQLYFTGGVETAIQDNPDTPEKDKRYTASTKAVARARNVTVNKSQGAAPKTVSMRSLNPQYSCNVTGADWRIRTDFGTAQYDSSGNITSSSPSDIQKWVHEQDRQAQQITIDTNKPLYLTSLAISDPNWASDTTCLNADKGNPTLGDSDDWHNVDPVTKLWEAKDGIAAVSHTFDFKDPTTFNGTKESNPSYDNSTVNDSENRVRVLKLGSTVPLAGKAYDSDNDTSTTDASPQKSLGEFLATQNPPLAKLKDDGITYEITNLGEDERIVAVEISWEEENFIGFDLQDNIFIVKSDAFEKEYSDGCFNGGTCNIN